MDTQKLFQIVITELTIDNLKLEVELADVINGKLNVREKTDIIKSILSNIVNNDASLVKFTNLVSNNDESKKEKNGKD